MTETLQPATEPAIQRPHRLYQAVAWVAIVAGVVFVVAMVFFTGFIIGRASDGGGGRHGHSMSFHHGPPPGMESRMAPPPMPSPPAQSPSTPPARP